MGFSCGFQVTLEFSKIVLILLHEIERTSGVSELLINYKQYLITFELYNTDLLGFACEFQVNSKFYKIFQVLLNKIKRNSGSPELLISYKQFLLTFQLHDHDLLGFACEFQISSEFYMIALVLLHEAQRSFSP